MKVNYITRGTRLWDNIDTPRFNECSINWDLWVPLNLEFNTTFYRQRGARLVAFKILAYARKYVRGYNMYLIQMPGEAPQWEKEFVSNGDVIFRSKEDFFAYLEGDISRGFVVKMGYIRHILGGDCNRWEKTWCWDVATSQPKMETTCIRYLTITSEGLNIVFATGRDSYWSPEECIAARLDGMEIVEFPDDEFSVNISIEVAPNPPKIHTLKFMEE